MSKGDPIQLDAAIYVAQKWEAKWRELEPDRQIYVCGSIRRKEKMVRDIDILIVDPAKHGTLQNDTKFEGVMMNLYWTNEECLGASKLFLTGSSAFNIRMRAMAKRKGYKLNRYGLWRGDECIASRTEEDIFNALGMEFVAPEQRRDPANDQKGITIQSTSTEGTWYEVYIADVHGFNFCPCKGFKYQQKCRHLREAAAKV